MRQDPHSYADLAQGRVVDVSFEWDVRFVDKLLKGRVVLRFDRPRDGVLDLDTRGLKIVSVHAKGEALAFELAEADPVLGQRLRILRKRPVDSIEILYQTSRESTGLMWLSPEQTSGELPFMLSQCQAIHARSLAPLQDTPRARITYTANITAPASMSVVMSAEPGTPVSAPDQPTKWAFRMPQPIPPYLLAIAVGELESRDLGPRTRVFAEPAVIESAAWEFAEAEQMLKAAESLFGPYRWGRYDVIVLPASFPLGGMENPRMTFLTPTLLAGDRSLVSVLAHELAHSWTGNLVTNATNEDFWLNEGWTVYAERRIVEVLYGVEVATQDACLGRQALDEVMRDRRSSSQSNALIYDQDGLDPDAEFSLVPYEKGFLFISALERSVGRAAFDGFLHRYIETFAFQSITTADFLDFVRQELPSTTVDLTEWTTGEGLPSDAPVFVSDRLKELHALAVAWPEGARPERGWTTNETLYYLSSLPALTGADCDALDQRLGLSASRNDELLSAWLELASTAGLSSVRPQLVQFLGRVGRTKYVRPVIRAMRSSTLYAPLAEELVNTNASRWHSSTRLAVGYSGPNGGVA